MTGLPRFLLYGTLRRGERSHEQLGLGGRLRYLMPGLARGRLFDLGPYPAFVPGEGVVQGDLFEPTDPSVLADLDAFEEYDPADPAGSLYVRESAVLLGPPHEALVYRYTGSVDGLPEIVSGDWIAYRTARDGPV